MKAYLGRMKAKQACPPRKPIPTILWSWLGALVGIYAIGACTPLVADAAGLDGAYLLGSFGAAAVLVYGAPMAEFSQPRNLIVGNAISALVGVCVASNVVSTPSSTAFTAALAVSTSVLIMHLLRSMHPPGGATALIAVVGGESIGGLGYWYVLFPVLCGSLILLAVALVVNNMSSNPHRHYPVYWF